MVTEVRTYRAILIKIFTSEEFSQDMMFRIDKPEQDYIVKSSRLIYKVECRFGVSFASTWGEACGDMCDMIDSNLKESNNGKRNA